MKILNFGSANIDFVYSLDHIAKEGETLSCHELNTFPGGKGLNQSIALARAGACIHFAGSVGQDGELLINTFKDNGVDISHLTVDSGKSGHAIIQVSSAGENSIFVYPGTNGNISKNQIDVVLSHFHEGDILLLQNEINNLHYLIDEAYKKGMCIVLNPSPINSTIFTINFHKLSYLILNEVEAQDITEMSLPEEALNYFLKHYPSLKIMLTLGKKGCIYADKTQRVYQPIFETQVVDTTAAGDTFTGYFISGLANNENIPEILKLASCAAAITVSRHGAAPSIPYLDEVMQGLTVMKAKPKNIKTETLRDALVQYITANLQTASLEEFADSMQYSPVYIGNLIWKGTGMHFKQIIQQERIQRAAYLLITSELSVEAIIESVGYKNETFFRKIFKETYGQNPLQYRINGGHKNDKRTKA